MIEQDVMALPQLSLCELRELWKVYFEVDPLYGNRGYYIMRLAYRMQELAFGGLSTTLKDELTKKDLPCRLFPRHAKLPPPGTIITKTYRGYTLTVKILDRGFEWNNTHYHSLSAVAQAITGTKVSGFYFFGFGGKR